MINGRKLVVVLPAYNAGKTLEKTYREIPFDIVDEAILVDDDSTDNTVGLARSLGIGHVIEHDRNRGYGGNQKTCYDDDFIFDNEAISQVFMAGYRIGEISCPTRYFEEESSIGLARSVRYGLGVLRVSLQHLLHRRGLARIRRYAGGATNP
jgi:glycosyltransferase involved in cell wall biosynthesis